MSVSTEDQAITLLQQQVQSLQQQINQIQTRGVTPTNIYPAYDLPIASPGLSDSMVGIDEASVALRRFLLSSLPVTDVQQAALNAMQASVDGIVANQAAGQIGESAWLRLISQEPGISQAVGAQAAIPLSSDSGSHVDPIKSGNQVVPNAGLYIRRTTAADGWEWVQEDTLGNKADKAALDETNARLEPFERIGDAPPLLSLLDEDGRLIGKLTGREVVVEPFERIESPDDLTLPIVDKDGRVIIRIPKACASYLFVERICDADAPVPLVIDPNGRVVVWNSGSSASATKDYYAPCGFYFPERMRKLNLFRAGRGADKSVRLSLGIIGDSWVDGAEYWMRTLCKMLRNKFGDGGIGYADIGSYSVLRDDVMTRTIGSDWVLQDETVPGPAIYSRTCSVAGGAINYVVSNAPALTGARLYWIGSTDGVIRYRWDGSDWTTLNVQGSGAQTADLTGYASAGSYTLDIELVSGTAQLCGIDFQSADAGIVVHKLGNAGSRADDWLSVDATIWEGFITQLDFDSAAICLGTNDRFAGVSADIYASRISEMITRIRTALPDSASLPGPDIMSIIPSRVWRDTPLSMAEYKSAILGIADDLDIAVTELISAIGDPYTRRDWFDSNGVHPLPESGGLVVASRLFAALNS